MNILSFEVENVKRVKVVEVKCDGKSLIIMGGNNRQGKSSVLDALKWALLGKTYAPSGLKREGTPEKPQVKVTLSNGLTVERYGDDGKLKITAPSGAVSRKEGDLLAIINLLSLDLGKFLHSSNKEKADALLSIIGYSEKLKELDRKEQGLEEDRLLTGREKRAKEAHADQLPWFENVPLEINSYAELRDQLQSIDKVNNDNKHYRDLHQTKLNELKEAQRQRDELAQQLKICDDKIKELATVTSQGEAFISSLKDIDPVPVEQQISQLEEINNKVRANQAKTVAKNEADKFGEKYSSLDDAIQQVRCERTALLESVELPLPGLSVAGGELIYNGQKWDCMSGAEQLMVATSIVRKQNSDCGFVLIDGLEQMDLSTLKDYAEWLAKEGMQAITTRVSNGDECSIIIEDGMVKG